MTYLPRTARSKKPFSRRQSQCNNPRSSRAGRDLTTSQPLQYPSSSTTLTPVLCLHLLQSLALLDIPQQTRAAWYSGRWPRWSWWRRRSSRWAIRIRKSSWHRWRRRGSGRCTSCNGHRRRRRRSGRRIRSGQRRRRRSGWRRADVLRRGGRTIGRRRLGLIVHGRHRARWPHGSEEDRSKVFGAASVGTIILFCFVVGVVRRVYHRPFVLFLTDTISRAGRRRGEWRRERLRLWG